MKLHAGSRATIVCLAVSLVPLLAFSNDQPLPLKHGVYVRGKSCTDPANAEILNWDGVGFSGAHSSHCTSQVTPQGKRFLVKNTCGCCGRWIAKRCCGGFRGFFFVEYIV
jgi:hypothetical protein